MERSDAQLLAASLTDPGAFGCFYDRYEAAIVGFFVRRTRDPELSADLTAEVFAAALGAAASYRPDQPTAAVWLFTIARNKLSKSLRKGRVETAARRQVGSGAIELQDDSLDRLAAADGERWVAELLARLPDDQREAIEARVLGEQSYEEIAGRLQTSPLVVRKRVSRGLARLRSELERPT
ncbi:MAG: RNA polymerase sigma factor [Trebonia sp.]